VTTIAALCLEVDRRRRLRIASAVGLALLALCGYELATSVARSAHPRVSPPSFVAPTETSTAWTGGKR
jgi:hypothetical protein